MATKNKKTTKMASFKEWPLWNMKAFSWMKDSNKVKKVCSVALWAATVGLLLICQNTDEAFDGSWGILWLFGVIGFPIIIGIIIRSTEKRKFYTYFFGAFGLVYPICIAILTVSKELLSNQQCNFALMMLILVGLIYVVASRE